MRRLSNSSAMSEARRFKTLTLGRSVGSGAAGVALPQATAQNQMIIASATSAWSLLAAPGAEGQVLVAGADPYTPVWGTTFPTVIQLDAGLTLGGATGVNVVTVPDNVIQAMHIVDAGGIEYLRIISTNAQPVVVFNEGGADVDHRWEASGEPNALFVQGSTGYVALGHDDPEMIFHIKSSTADKAYIIIEECAATVSPPDIFFRKARGTGASPTDVAVSDHLGNLNFYGYRNSDWRGAGAIQVVVEALGTSAVRAGIVFSTVNDSDAPGERMRIDRNGKVTIIEDSNTTRLSGTKSFIWVIDDPNVAAFGQVRIPWGCTVRRVDANVIGGTSCTFNIEERGTLGSSGTNILSSDMAADVNGETVTGGFNNSSLAEGNYLTIDVSAVSGVVNRVSVTLTVTID